MTRADFPEGADGAVSSWAYRVVVLAERRAHYEQRRAVDVAA